MQEGWFTSCDLKLLGYTLTGRLRQHVSLQLAGLSSCLIWVTSMSVSHTNSTVMYGNDFILFAPGWLLLYYGNDELREGSYSCSERSHRWDSEREMGQSADRRGRKVVRGFFGFLFQSIMSQQPHWIWAFTSLEALWKMANNDCRQVLRR